MLPLGSRPVPLNLKSYQTYTYDVKKRDTLLHFDYQLRPREVISLTAYRHSCTIRLVARCSRGLEAP